MDVIFSLTVTGKGGYSYSVYCKNSPYVLKRIHREPVDYNTFGDKMAAELKIKKYLKV